MAGTVITVIGVSLLPVSIMWAAGGNPFAKDYGSPANITTALAVLVVILLITRFAGGFLGRIAILLGLVIGTAGAALFGHADFSQVGQAAWVRASVPFHFGVPTFHLIPILSMTLVMLITMVETTADMLAISEITEKPMSPEDLARAQRDAP